MKDKTLVFAGSKDDLEALRKALSDEGIEEFNNDVVKAEEATGAIVVSTIVFVLTKVAVPVIQTYLRERKKRLVVVGEEKTIISGYDAEDVAKIYEGIHSVRIEDDPAA